MTKCCLMLSKSMAFAAALYAPALFVSPLSASPSPVVDQDNYFGLSVSSGHHIQPSVSLEDSARETHQEILNKLSFHFKRSNVSFTYKTVRCDYAQGILKPVQKLSQSNLGVVQALQGKLGIWAGLLNTFVENYCEYASTKRDVELLRLINDRYARRAIVIRRQDPLNEVLDGHYVTRMGQIMTAIIHSAQSAGMPITNEFNPKRDTLWNHLAACVVDVSTYDEESLVGQGIQAFVNGSRLEHAAFQKFFSGILFSNQTLGDLIENLESRTCNLPRFKYAKYQALLGAEAVSLMIMFQQSLVDPATVNSIFAVNKGALAAEQARFLESGIEHAKRSRFLLANRLVPEALNRQRKQEIQQEAEQALGEYATESLIKRWSDMRARMTLEEDVVKARLALGDFVTPQLVEEWVEAQDAPARALIVEQAQKSHGETEVEA